MRHRGESLVVAEQAQGNATYDIIMAIKGDYRLIGDGILTEELVDEFARRLKRSEKFDFSREICPHRAYSACERIIVHKESTTH